MVLHLPFVVVVVVHCVSFAHLTVVKLTEVALVALPHTWLWGFVKGHPLWVVVLILTYSAVMFTRTPFFTVLLWLHMFLLGNVTLSSHNAFTLLVMLTEDHMLSFQGLHMLLRSVPRVAGSRITVLYSANVAQRSTHLFQTRFLIL